MRFSATRLLLDSVVCYGPRCRNRGAPVIKAISFDLWDTVIDDDSDEPKRAELGLRSKHLERRHCVWAALNEVEPNDPIEQSVVTIAYDVTEAAFNRVWRHHSITWTVAERLEVLLTGLGRELPAPALEEVIRIHEEMEIIVAPDPIAGAGTALAQLAQEYALCVVSDAIVSPGRILRQWLELQGLAQYFSGFAFSDEVGHAKPHADMFAAAAKQVGVELSEMVHIGDRDHNDIKGAQALGMKTILFTATRDRDAKLTSADAICGSYAELPAIIARLAAA